MSNTYSVFTDMIPITVGQTAQQAIADDKGLNLADPEGASQAMALASSVIGLYVETGGSPGLVFAGSKGKTRTPAIGSNVTITGQVWQVVSAGGGSGFWLLLRG